MKIGIVGHFACGRQLLNGQTVKTINLYEGLTKYTNHQIEIADTHRWTHHPLRLLCEVNRLFRHCDAVVMLPAHNGVKVFALLFALLQRIYGTRTYYDVIGGWLPSMLLEHKWLRRPLAHFSGIWVETTTMERALQQQGLENVAVVPNFKELTPLAPTALIYPEGIPFRLCTFSRVNREKGIETAVRALREVNEQLGFTAYTLDIYGPVDPAQAEWFAALQQTFPSCVAYRGTVDSSRSVEVLQGYFALLFPTHYYTEGIPGTIIDAYCAGVPVIAARWESFADVVKEGETGLGYPFDDAAALKALLLEVADEPAKLLKLKPNCLQQAQLFMPNRVINIQKTCLGGVI